MTFHLCCKVKPRKVVLQTTKLNPTIHHHFIQRGVSRQLNCHFPLNFYWFWITQLLLEQGSEWCMKTLMWLCHVSGTSYTRCSLMNGQFCLDDDKEPPLHIFPWTALFGLFAPICVLDIGCVIVICSLSGGCFSPLVNVPFKVMIFTLNFPILFLTVHVIIS